MCPDLPLQQESLPVWNEAKGLGFVAERLELVARESAALVRLVGPVPQENFKNFHENQKYFCLKSMRISVSHNVQ
jgi:hypothetical protein